MGTRRHSPAKRVTTKHLGSALTASGEQWKRRRGLQEDFVQKRRRVSVADYAALEEQPNQLLR